MIHLCLLCTEENLQINELLLTARSLSSAGECPQWRHTFSVIFVGAFVVDNLLVLWVSQAGRQSLTHCTSTKTFTRAAESYLTKLALTLLAGRDHFAVL